MTILVHSAGDHQAQMADQVRMASVVQVQAASAWDSKRLHWVEYIDSWKGRWELYDIGGGNMGTTRIFGRGSRRFIIRRKMLFFNLPPPLSIT